MDVSVQFQDMEDMKGDLTTIEDVEGVNEDEYHHEEALFNDQLPSLVRLKGQGLQLADVKDQGGDFEIDDEDLLNQDEDDNPLEYDKEAQKFAKHELLADEAQGSDDNDEGEAVPPFTLKARGMVDITKEADGGVLKKIVRAGDGHLVPEHATVTIQYHGYLQYTAEPFDSSELRGSMQVFRLNTGEVVLGLDVAVASMKKGEKAEFLVHPDYAFGSMGCPPRIPGNEVILFEVELLNFVDDKSLVDYDHMSQPEQALMSFEKLYEVCVADHMVGNEYFKKQQYAKAALRYEHGARLLENCRLKNEDEQIKNEHLMVKLLVNLAIVKDQQQQYRKAATYAKRALHLDKNNTKALFRLGRCQRELGEFSSAKAALICVKQREPNNPEIQKELEKLNVSLKQSRVTERQLYMRMMAPVSKPLSKKEAVENDGNAVEEKMASLSVSGDFKELVDKQIAQFAANVSQKDLILPEGMNAKEQAYVAYVAKTHDVRMTCERRDGCIHVRLYKAKK